MRLGRGSHLHAPRGGRERRAGRAPRGGRELRPRRRSARSLREAEAPAEPRLGSAAGVRGHGEERRAPRRSRRTRATSCVTQLRRRGRAPRARSRAPAAQRAPTVRRDAPRGELAENRNQRAEWIDKAEALVAKGGVSRDDRIDVAPRARGARARGARTGATRSRSTRRCSRSIPDNVAAILAHVELYDEAGLRDDGARVPRSARSRGDRAASRSLRAMVDVASRAGPHDRGRRGGGALRGAPLRRSRRRSASKVELAVARRDTTRRAALDRSPRRDQPRQRRHARSSRRRRTSRSATRRAPIALYNARARSRARKTPTRCASSPTSTRVERPARRAAARCCEHILELSRRRRTCASTSRTSSPRSRAPTRPTPRPPSEFLAKRGAPADGADAAHARRSQVTTVFPNGLASRFHQVVFQPLTDARPREAARVRLRLRGRLADRAAPRRARVPQGRHGRRGDRERRPARGRRPVDRDVHERARRTTCTSRASSAGDVVELQYRVEDVAAAQRVRRLLRRGRLPAVRRADRARRVRAHHAEERARSISTSRTSPARRTTEDKGDAAHLPLHRARTCRAVEPEPLQPPSTEVLRHVHVSTYKSWDEMGAWYWGLVKDQFTADDEVRRRVAEITKGLKTTERDKVNAIYDYVVQKTRYVALEFGIHGFKPYRCAQIFARGFGDCKDKATLIVTMLQGARHPRDDRHRAHGHEGRLRDQPGEPRAVRSRDRVRAVARPLPRRHRRVHRLDRAPGDGPRRARAPGQRGQAEARAPARSAARARA